MTSGRSLDDLHDLVDEVPDIIGRCPGGLLEMSGRSLETFGRSSEMSGRSLGDFRDFIEKVWEIFGPLKAHRRARDIKTAPILVDLDPINSVTSCYAG